MKKTQGKDSGKILFLLSRPDKYLKPRINSFLELECYKFLLWLTTWLTTRWVPAIHSLQALLSGSKCQRATTRSKNGNKRRCEGYCEVFGGEKKTENQTRDLHVCCLSLSLSLTMIKVNIVSCLAQNIIVRPVAAGDQLQTLPKNWNSSWLAGRLV